MARQQEASRKHRSLIAAMIAKGFDEKMAGAGFQGGEEPTMKSRSHQAQGQTLVPTASQTASTKTLKSPSARLPGFNRTKTSSQRLPACLDSLQYLVQGKHDAHSCYCIA